MAVHREEPAKGPAHERQPHVTKRERARHATGNETEQLIFTLNAATGDVVKIEKVDVAGKRRELPKDETAAIAGKGSLHEIEAALDEAFEAGISSVIEPISGEDLQDETEEEMELRRFLITHIIGQDVRRKLQRRLVQRLILSRTLGH